MRDRFRGIASRRANFILAADIRFVLYAADRALYAGNQASGPSAGTDLRDVVDAILYVARQWRLLRPRAGSPPAASPLAPSSRYRRRHTHRHYQSHPCPQERFWCAVARSSSLARGPHTSSLLQTHRNTHSLGCFSIASRRRPQSQSPVAWKNTPIGSPQKGIEFELSVQFSDRATPHLSSAPSSHYPLHRPRLGPAAQRSCV